MADASQQERIERLRKVPLFAQLSDDALDEVLAHSTEFEARSGHVLVQPRQPGAGLFVIEEGEVTVELPNKKVTLGPGDFFGELALLREDGTHMARVCTASEVRAVAIGRDDFATLLEKQPTIAVAMLKTLAKRLADNTPG